MIITPIDRSKYLRNTKPIAIQKEINTQVGTIKSVTKQGSALVLECFNSKQVNKLLEQTKFKEIDVKTESYIPFKGSRGVIKGVDVEISDHEALGPLQDALGHYSVGICTAY